MCINLKHIRTFLDTYQHVSYHAESKYKKEINILTMKTHQMLNKWQHLTCIKLSNQNLQNDIVTPKL